MIVVFCQVFGLNLVQDVLICRERCVVPTRTFTEPSEWKSGDVASDSSTDHLTIIHPQSHRLGLTWWTLKLLPN